MDFFGIPAQHPGLDYSTLTTAQGVVSRVTARGSGAELVCVQNARNGFFSVRVTVPVDAAQFRLNSPYLSSEDAERLCLLAAAPLDSDARGEALVDALGEALDVPAATQARYLGPETDPTWAQVLGFAAASGAVDTSVGPFQVVSTLSVSR